MCIYCETSNYRKIYEHHHGPILKDSDGRTYEVHHIDGNRSNNHYSNLLSVSIQEHYDIHYAQGDWAACLRIAAKMKCSPQQLSELASKQQKERITNGTHPFSDSEWQRNNQKAIVDSGKHNFLGGTIQKRTNDNRVKDGSHHWLGDNNHIHQKIKDGTYHMFKQEHSDRVRNQELEKIKNGTHPFLDGGAQRERQLLKVKNGTHHMMGSNNPSRKKVQDGTHNFLVNHPNKIQVTCPYCQKVGGSTNMKRYHFTNCKSFTKANNDILP